MKLCHVTWRDSCFEGGDVLSRERFGDLIDIESAGIYLGEDEEKITLASDYYPSTDEARYVYHIAKVNIREMRMVEVGKAPKRKVKR